MEKEILTIDDLCTLLSVSRRTIYNLLKEEKIPGTKIGGQWRFSKKVIEKLFVKGIESDSDNKSYIKV